jgi:site-specific DNA-methyltransferase (adenine-specific)
MSTIQLENMEGLEYLKQIDSNSVDLVLTDPPYITSRDSGMDQWVDHVAHRKNSAGNLKTEKDWRALKTAVEWKAWTKKGGYSPGKQRLTALRNAKKNYLKYGSIYGEKYAVRTDYGKWDSDFTMDKMEQFVEQFYRTLRPGGTCIIFFDIWKLSYLKEMLEKYKFKQIRFVEWIKTNPQPLNSSRNYLTNCREIALLAVKKGSPTFNSKYDNAVYLYEDPETYLFPIQGGKWRMMPTQKSLSLCEALIQKHSNEGDLILDPFLGAGTTAVAAANTGRRFTGCELRKDMFNQMMERIKGEVNGEEE